ncbi:MULTISPECIES: hypothetical protein [Methanohalophilus]|jgi:hypothetical protein|uniref:Uncharacterized protein n=1 Tax=Methanohalophilus euhalobius TaxID=51203 RepID=A0A285GHB2_9EURY|nr:MULTISPECIES: hypothetical protein [Methanohalophilus]KXS43950.1 MAG: hypothetical protein AWU58_1243 [Methanohalophilus sp. T328-1]RSD33136.1 MAG: hypothetical protein CI952_1657 [Methanohalophilus sp.]ODV49901.1 MAG: hypothetical protein A8273_560 [Methanohalophilus sp. 2-GBenrich]PQV43236.1 hypothetical protein B0H22_103250 [Methanohalophilus euhalobius]RSD33366.1 MAG: hypothetical protein CI953_1613 [Methanohalophilus sp.]
MVQTEAAMEAYDAYFANAYVPAADYVWPAVVLIIAFLAIWQARTWVSNF